MNWKALIVKKAVIGRLPLADQLRTFKRKTVGYPPNPDHLELTIRCYGRIKKAIESLGHSINGSVVLEIGSGWFPVIPILLARDGARQIVMSDLNVHMDDITFRETASFLKKRFPDDEYIQNIKEFQSMPITYCAPFDAARIGDNSLDIIISNTVLEHIPRSDIYNLFSTLRPKISPAGSMVHLVDHSDHFEHYDKSLSKINFLTWTEEKHAVINYLIRDGENRMRHHEYHQVFADSGYEVIEEETDIDEKTLQTVDTLQLVYPYSRMQPEQLAAITSIYSCRPL